MSNCTAHIIEILGSKGRSLTQFYFKCSVFMFVSVFMCVLECTRRVLQSGKAKSNAQVQNQIDDYEPRSARYMVDYSAAEPVTEDIKNDCLMQLVPEKLETAIQDSIMTVEREGNKLDYASLRAIIVKRVEGDSEQVSDPMDVCQVEQRDSNDNETDVNALSPKG